MPDTQDQVQVKMPDGRMWNIPRTNLLKAKARGAVEVSPEGAMTKIGRGAALGVASGLGIPETQHPVKDLFGNLAAQGKEQEENPVSSIGKVLLGPAPMLYGLGKNLYGAGKEGYKGISGNDPEEAAHGISSLLTQLLTLKGGKEAATTPIGESEILGAGKAGGEVVQRGLQRAVVSDSEIVKAHAEHTAKMADVQIKNFQALNDATAEFDRDMKEAEKEHQKAVNETEGTNLQKEAAHKLKVEQIKEKHAAQLAKDNEAYKQKVSQLRREYEDKISAFNKPGESAESGMGTAAETKRKSLTTQPRSGPVYQRIAGMADKIAETVPALSKKVRSAYDARWNAWREAMGDAEGNFTPVQQAVQEAEDSILKGSPENIQIFRNILKEGEDPILANASVFRSGAGIDVKDIIGSRFMSEATRNRVMRSLEDAGVSSETGRMPLAETTLPVDEIRGYLTELQQKMHGGKFTGDVYRALKHVQEAANKEIERVAGEKGQLGSYRKLKSDWSQFLGDFYDSDGALKKLQNAVNSDARLNLLSGSEGSRIIDAMGRYASFGPDIDSVGRLRSLMKQLRELPSRAREVTAPELPGKPAAPPEPALPEPPTPKAPPEFKPPKKREVREEPVEPFSEEKFRRQKISSIAEGLHRITGWELASIGYALREILYGEVPWGMTYPVVKRTAAALLSNPKVVDYLTRELAKD